MISVHKQYINNTTDSSLRCIVFHCSIVKACDIQKLRSCVRMRPVTYIIVYQGNRNVIFFCRQRGVISLKLPCREISCSKISDVLRIGKWNLYVYEYIKLRWRRMKPVTVRYENIVQGDEKLYVVIYCLPFI